MITISARRGVFELRRRAVRQGHFQQERWGRGPWRPVGALAVRKMKEHGGRSATVRHLLARGIKVHSHMEPRGVAVLWRASLEALTNRRVRRGLDVAWSRSVFPLWATWVPPRGSARQMVQPFFLTVNEEAGAISLSAIYGLVSGRLVLCRRCREPFLRSSTRRRCPACDREMAYRTAAGLPRRLSQTLWFPLRRRLTLRVRRGTLAPEERSRRLQAGLRDLRKVAKEEMAETAWRERHDERLPAGRKPVVPDARRR